MVMSVEKYEKLCEKIVDDWNRFVQPWNMDKEDAIRDAYRIAHANEIEDIFCNVDIDEPPFDDEEVDKMLNCNENIIQKVWDSWMSYSHPERYNFFAYEDLLDIIRCALFQKE